MFRNYFTTGIRNILKYKVFSFINVFGLAVAMSVCMLIILMLADQHRYDQFNTKKDRIYRVLSKASDSRQPYATSPFPLATELKAEYPIIEETVGLNPEIGGDATYGQKIAEIRGYFASPSFFNVFDFELEAGDKSTALTAPRSVIINKKLADRFFKNQDPVGKAIEFSDRQLAFPIQHDGVGTPSVPWGSFTVTGVVDESKYKSHLEFDVLISSSSREALYAGNKLKDQSGDWDWYFKHYTYVLLAPGKTESDLVQALNDLVIHKYATSKAEQTKGFQLSPQNIGDIQLDLAGNDTKERFPRFGYYFLGGLAATIMLLACLNYTNLSIARALTRAKEIGVRKVTGASRRSLIFQFLSESVITTLLALMMAIVLLLFIKPAFKGLWVNQYLNFELPSSVAVYLIFTGFALAIGLAAGIYPAFHLSTYQPIKALKDLGSIKPGKLGLRKVLSVSQFVISLFFIATSILIYNQFRHYIKFDYGFTPQNLLNVELQGQNFQRLANEFSSIPGVSTISAADILPATGRSNGIQLKKVHSADEFTEGYVMNTDEKFIGNLGLQIIAGKDLPALGDSASQKMVVNEAMTRQLGYKYPGEIVGEVYEAKWGGLFEVVGVVKDFRFNLLINSHDIKPLALFNHPEQFQYLNIKITSADAAGVVQKMKDKWKKIDPNHAFKYDFFDQQLLSTHQGVFDAVSIIGFVAFLAITIACLGLLGMATYTVERKTKEVGIRKVLGADAKGIAFLLSREFLKMLVISVCIGAPLSYLVNNLWLQMLPNRVEFGAASVMLGSLVLLIVGLITIASQTFNASKRNPVDSLRAE